MRITACAVAEFEDEPGKSRINRVVVHQRDRDSELSRRPPAWDDRETQPASSKKYCARTSPGAIFVWTRHLARESLSPSIEALDGD